MTTDESGQNSTSEPVGPSNRPQATLQNIGLCGRCTHARPVAGARSVFLRCALAKTDPDFPRYPALPVTACKGFVERAGAS